MNKKNGNKPQIPSVFQVYYKLFGMKTWDSVDFL